MSNTLLEQARSAMEHIETFEQEIAKQLDAKTKTQKQQVWQQHHIKNLIDGIVEQSNASMAVVKDDDKSFADELDNMKGRNAFGSFYESLRETKEYHLRFPNIQVAPGPKMESVMECKAQFSGSEVFGKYLDLFPFHERSCNMKPFGQSEFGNFLETFHDFSKVERSLKSAAYVEYVKDLAAYLVAFFERSQPLVDKDELLAECEEAFDTAWKDKKVPGWSDVAVEPAGAGEDAAAKPAGKELDLAKFHSAKDLEALGINRLKEALMALGMKCGGTVSDRAERLIKVKGLAKDQIPASLLAKSKGGRKRKRGGDGLSQDVAVLETIAKVEFRVGFLCEQMADIVDATRRYVEKRQTQLIEERDAEIDEEETGHLAAMDDEEEDEEDEEPDDDEPLYNPLNLPLGWDGKPIPYWLYKLHGLGVEYKCEICGNMSYWGRRAFDKHFQDWRHAYGMRCLKIPNTKHFHDITLIEDAVNLHKKIQEGLQAESFNATQEEEFEDNDGHVLNRRTFEDLARQGLL